MTSLKTVSATAAKPVWSQAWLNALHRLHLLGPRTATDNSSRVRRLEIALGQVTAEVQQRDRTLCQVTLQFTPLAEGAWQGALQIFREQLAGGRLIEPYLAFPESEPAFGTLADLLLPDHSDAIQASCSCCPDQQNLRNCAALQTVYRQLGAMLDEEPVLLLRLRSREWQHVIQALQQQPATDYGKLPPTQATSRRHPPSDGGTGDALGDSEDLRNALGNFWGSRREMESFHHHIATPTIDLAILRRLGPLPDGLADAAVDQQLATLYRLVSQKAEALAYDLYPVQLETVSPNRTDPENNGRE